MIKGLDDMDIRVSKGILAGVLLAFLAIFLIDRFKSDERTPPATDSESVSTTPTPSVGNGPQPTATERVPPSEQYIARLRSVSGTARIYGTNAPAIGVPVRAISREVEILLTHTDEKGSYTLTGEPIERAEGFLFIRAGDTAADLVMLDSMQVHVKKGESKTGIDLILHVGEKGSVSGKVIGRRVLYQNVDSITTKTTVEDCKRIDDVPLPGIKVFLAHIGRHTFATEVLIKEEITTDETGSYAFENLRAGYYIVWAERPDFAAIFSKVDGLPSMPQPPPIGTNPSRTVKVESEPTTGTDFRFRLDGVSVSGHVTDRDGQPIEGAEIALSIRLAERFRADPSATRYHQAYSMIAHASSDATGYYHLDNLPKMPLGDIPSYVMRANLLRYYVISARAEGFSPVETIVPPFTENQITAVYSYIEDYLKSDIATANRALKTLEIPDVALPSSQGDDITDIDIVLAEQAVVSGHVIDTRGKPVTDPRRIRILFADSKSTATTRTIPPSKDDWTRLDESGRFQFTNIPPGRYAFEVSNTHPIRSQKARNELLSVQAGEVIDDLEIVVESSEDRGNISGRVIDARTGEPVDLPGWIFNSTPGSPLVPLGIRVKHLQSAHEETPSLGNATMDKADKGSFSIEGISPGIATLEISPSGYVGHTAKVEVLSGKTINKTFYLDPRGGISGLVLDALSGAPVPKFSVKVIRVDAPEGVIASHGKVVRDESKEGEFSIVNIKPGTATIQISALGYAKKRAQVEVKGGSRTDEVFLLDQEGVLRGYVYLNGKVLTSANVSIRPFANLDNQSWKTIQRYKKTGPFEFKQLEEGSYWIRATHIFMGSPRATRYFLGQVSVKSGEETTQNVHFRGDCTVRGSITCPDKKGSLAIRIIDHRIDSSLSEKDRTCATFFDNYTNTYDYSIDTLSPGSYTIIAGYYVKNVAVMEKSANVVMQGGQSLEVLFAFP